MSMMPRGAGWPAAVLFDLDGTLIDSAPDIARSANILLKRYGHEPLAEAQVAAMVGNGIRKLVERVFAAVGPSLDTATLDAREAEMMAVYGENLTVGTRLLDGAGEAIAALSGTGAKLAVVTNKPERFARTILDHFRVGRLIDLVIGGDSGMPMKPAPAMLEAALAQFGVAPVDALMVGDAAPDRLASQAAGIACALVGTGYGYRLDELPEPEIRLATLFELEGAIADRRAAA